MNHLIYLDHAATTPLRVEAREAMGPFLTDNYANPSSVYRLAQTARSALDQARDSVADCLGARPSEIVFCSGGSESNNAAIKGVAFASQARGRHIVTTAIEHHAVLHSVEELCERFGFTCTVVPVPSNGIVDPSEIERALRPETILVSVMWANNEIGTIQPVERIGILARSRHIPFHVDAVQAAGVLSIDLSHVPIDLLSLSAHKFYGPKGCGLLYVRQGTPWWPIIVGGGQERNRRAGTENVAGIAGMATALSLACEEREKTTRHLKACREYLFQTIPIRVPDTHLNGDTHHRLPGNVNVSFEGVHGESLLVGLDMAGIMASSGSACTSGSTETSHVLRAIGLPDSLARASLRLTMGRETTREECSQVVGELERLVGRLRRLASTVSA